nr:thiamine pyrophosphate-dependent enzyme [Candidatus Freyrarchaeum guaymaensis]
FAAMIQELETAVRHGINVVVVVMNNRGTAEIKQIQQVKHSERYIGVDYLDVDFSQVAKGFRAYGERVEKPGDVHGALERAFEAGKPAVVDVVFDDSGEISPWVLREALRREVAR